MTEYAAQFVGGPLDGMVIRVASDPVRIETVDGQDMVTYDHTDGPFWEAGDRRPLTPSETLAISERTA